MEYTLRDPIRVRPRNRQREVLILILMEYTLRATRARLRWSLSLRLNPYSNGIYSTSGVLDITKVTDENMA